MTRSSYKTLVQIDLLILAVAWLIAGNVEVSSTCLVGSFVVSVIP